MARSSKRSEENDAVLAAMGERIAVRRATKRMSQRELAAICDVDIKTISRVELGDISPSIITLVAIAKALELPLDYLVYGTDCTPFAEPQLRTNQGAVGSGVQATANIRSLNENTPPTATAYIITQEQMQEQMDGLRRRLEEVERKQK